MITGKSGTATTSVNSSGLAARFTWADEYDIVGNYSIVTLKTLKIFSNSRTGSHWVSGTVEIGSKVIRIAGSTDTTATAVYLSVGSYASVGGFDEPPWDSSQIEHDSDGSKTITVKFNLTLTSTAGYSSLKISESVKIALSDIPQGLGYIDSSKALGKHLIYVDTGTKLVGLIPRIDNGKSWDFCS